MMGDGPVSPGITQRLMVWYGGWWLVPDLGGESWGLIVAEINWGH